MRRNSVLTGSGDFVGDQADAVVERQAGLDGAHDDVERIGKFVEERLDAAARGVKETNQRGRPSAPATKAPGSTSSGAPSNEGDDRRATTPQMTE